MKRSAFVSLCFLFAALAGARLEGAPLQICTTTADLGSLVREVAGGEAEVTVFAKPAEDPHFVEARPSFIKALSRADLFVQTGLYLEAAWVPVLLQNARNSRVLPGAAGFLDASRAVEPIMTATGIVDRSMGDVHPSGNPHYLLDPVNGLAVARLIAGKLAELRPGQSAVFQKNADAFAARLERDLPRWTAALKPYAGQAVIVDHNLWPYLTRRFGLEIGGTLEPKPGLAPTTKNLMMIIEQMRLRRIRVLLAAPYYDPRHAKFIEQRTGAKIARMAHQVGSRSGTADYLSFVDYNVQQLVAALAAQP
jgi:ABC-type Zn uptake system ZnuABC Zn-binding protein ZnuA